MNSKTILILIISQLCQIYSADFFRFAVGEFDLIGINDFVGSFNFTELFLNGALGIPIPSAELIPQLNRIGFTLNGQSTQLAVPYMVLYGKIGEIEFIIDTGIGLRITPQSQLKKQLNLLNIDPASIDFVILTHGHPDHTGGLLGPDSSLIFPSAKMIMAEDEYNLWTSVSPNWGDFCCPEILNALLPIIQAGLTAYPATQRILISNSAFPFSVIPGLTLFIEGGHTSDAHVILRISSKGETLWVLGDSAFSALHLEKAPTYACGHDHQQQEAMDSRVRISKVVAEDGLLFGMHFAFPSLGTLDSKGNFHFVNTTLA